MSINAPAAFQGDYVDLRFIKSRKVAQIVIEIPIEQASSFVASFGTPDPATGVPVGFARMDVARVANDERGGKKPRRKWEEMDVVTQCAMRCEETAFARFIDETFDFSGREMSIEDKVRSLLKIGSRREIATNDRAKARWIEIDEAFMHWMRMPV